MKQLILWTWQFPQTFLGWILTRIYYSEETVTEKYKECSIVYVRKFPSTKRRSGISLGKYIILDNVRFRRTGFRRHETEITIKHEYGHVRQGYIFGPLYLILVGLPSIIQNRLGFHFRLRNPDYYREYYNRYPEKWADRLGSVSKETRLKQGWIVK